MKVKEDDEILTIQNDVPNSTIMFITRKGMVLNFTKEDIPQQGRISGGVKGMLLADKDEVIAATQVFDSGEAVVITDKCFMKRVVMAEIEVMARYRKGVKIIDFNGVCGKQLAFADYVTEPYFTACFGEGEVFTVSTDDMAIDSRTGKGKPPKTKKKGVSLDKAVKCITVPQVFED